MRTFKFRVWDKRENYFVILDETYNVFALDDVGILDCDDRENFVFQQSTGLLDKNGKEIFEGDVVRLAHDEAFTDAEMVYSEGRYHLKGVGFEIRNIVFACEIIGNIFENSELVKK